MCFSILVNTSKQVYLKTCQKTKTVLKISNVLSSETFKLTLLQSALFKSYEILWNLVMKNSL